MMQRRLITHDLPELPGLEPDFARTLRLGPDDFEAAANSLVELKKTESGTILDELTRNAADEMVQWVTVGSNPHTTLAFAAAKPEDWVGSGRSAAAQKLCISELLVDPDAPTEYEIGKLIVYAALESGGVSWTSGK